MVAGLFLVLSLATAAPAAAEPHAPAPEIAPIVVQGVQDRNKAIRNFIRGLTPAPIHGQLSRFEAPVCPAVAGLPPEPASHIIERMRRVAAAAGIPIAKERCDANVVVIVTPDKAAFLKRLEQQRQDYFPPDWSGSQIDELERDPSPAAAWYFEGAYWADGRPISSDLIAATSSGADFLAGAQKTTEPLTRLKPSARHAFLTAVVVVQRSALDGLTTTELADYAAMRAFVRTDARRLENADTILRALDAPMGTPVPLTLTPWDLSFLKAFYASGNNSYAEYQRSEMQRLMKRELDRNQQRDAIAATK
jgi:hypothetical protein